MPLPLQPDPGARASPEFLALFRDRAGNHGTMTFAQFMELALYDPKLGYYRRPHRRIGFQPGTDFFTSATSGTVFGELVVAACVSLLRDADPREHTFVEIGAEPSATQPCATDGSSLSRGSDSDASPPFDELDPCPTRQGILAGVAHPFAAIRTIGAGSPINLTGKCVVFSNELFDAQPFHRFVFRKGAWRELGVQLAGAALQDVELPSAAPAGFPEVSAEGYIIDAPFASRSLAERIANETWTGLFVAFDYGKMWNELAETTPAGTARAYFRHTQSNDLLARPGEQDLTCHVCWDWLSSALLRHGFDRPQIESQEAFFIRHAGDWIAAASARDATRFSREKLSLLQLLHPSHMGQKFQVLHGLRHHPPPSLPS